MMDCISPFSNIGWGLLYVLLLGMFATAFTLVIVLDRRNKRLQQRILQPESQTQSQYQYIGQETYDR